MKKNIVIFLYFLVFQFMQIESVYADNVDADFQSVTINDATLFWDGEAHKGRLKFTVDNQSSADLILLGVEGGIFKYAEVLGRVSQEKLLKLTSFVVEQEEHLDFSTSHLQIILQTDGGQIKPSQDVDLRLHLSNGLIPFKAHVQMQPGKSDGELK